MKATAILIALFPIVCYAQKNSSATATEKPATDACPTFKKGKQPSKADYFRSLRTVKKINPNTPGNTELAYNAPRPVTAKRQPAEKPVTTNAQAERNYIPSFAGSEVAATPKKAAPAPTEKPIAAPKAEKSKAKPDAPEAAKAPESNKTATKKINTESKEKIKTRVKQQPAKKSTNAPGAKRVKTRRGNNEKCPAF